MSPKLKKIPIYGHLFVSRSENLRQALNDIGITTVFSLFPIWLYPIFSHIALLGGTSFLANVKGAIWEGELFIYSAAMVGPLIYAITKKYSDPSDKRDRPKDQKGSYLFNRKYEFPYGPLFTILSMMICVFAALSYGAIKAIGSYNLNIPLDREALFQFSILMYLFTLSCFYCVLVYRLNLETAAAAFGEDTDELDKEWKSHAK